MICIKKGSPDRLTVSDLSARIDSVQWSSENQLLVVFSESLLIHSPSAYVNLSGAKDDQGLPKMQSTTAVIFPPSEEDPSLQNKRTFQLYGSSIAEAQPRTFRCACWSPRNATRFGGCLLLALTNGHSAIIYYPADDPRSMMWRPLVNLDQILAKKLKDQDHLSFISCAWTSHRPIPLLALGSKSRMISFWGIKNDWKIDLVGYSAIDELLQEIKEDDWPIKMLWAPLAPLLVCAMSSGVVYLLHVDENTFEMKVAIVLFKDDPRQISKMMFLDCETILIAKGNSLFFYNLLSFIQHEHNLTAQTMVSGISIALTEIGWQLNIFCVDGCMFSVEYNKADGPRAAEAQKLEKLFAESCVLADRKNSDDKKVSSDCITTRFFGAASSGNNIFTAVHYGIFSKNMHKLEKQSFKYSYVEFLATGDQEFNHEIVKQCMSNRLRPPQLLELDPRSWSWDLLLRKGDTLIEIAKELDIFVLENKRNAPGITTKACQVRYYLSSIIRGEWGDIKRDFLRRYATCAYVFYTLAAIKDCMEEAIDPEIIIGATSFRLLLTTCCQILLENSEITEKVPENIKLFESVLQLYVKKVEKFLAPHESQKILDFSQNHMIMTQDQIQQALKIVSSPPFCPICKSTCKIETCANDDVTMWKCTKSAYHAFDACCFTFALIPTAKLRACFGCGVTRAVALTDPQAFDKISRFMKCQENLSKCTMCGSRMIERGNCKDNSSSLEKD